MKTQKITLPTGIATSIRERSMISAAISNLNGAKKYISEWLRNAKDCPNESNLACLDYAIQWGLKYANEFYAVEHLANTYRELWQEKYSKAKLTYENVLQKAETLLDNHKKQV